MISLVMVNQKKINGALYSYKNNNRAILIDCLYDDEEFSFLLTECSWIDVREIRLRAKKRGVLYGWIQAKVAVERGGVCVSGCDTHALW